jgi:hypothetical protein
MESHGIENLPLYPEERMTKRPTAEQILRLFSQAQRHVLTQDGQPLRSFQPELTPLQMRVLKLIGVPLAAYRPGTHEAVEAPS